MSSSSKNPPLLSNSATYHDWKKMLSIWKSFTPVEKVKQGGAVVMSLKGAAQEAALELDEAEINADDGLDKVVAKLDKLYLKDKTLEKFETLEEFDSLVRKPETTIQVHVQQFEKLYKKLKDKGTTMSEDLLAYKLLKSVQLSPQDEKLVKGTTAELTLDNMKTQLKKIFPDSGLKSKSADELLPNEINQVQCEGEATAETFYSNSRRGSYRDYQGTLYQPRRPPNPPPVYYRSNSSNRYMNPRGRRYVPFVQPRFPSPSPSRNPINPRTGVVAQCGVCSRTDHFARDCPDKQRSSQNFVSGNNVYYEEAYQTQHIPMYQQATPLEQMQVPQLPHIQRPQVLQQQLTHSDMSAESNPVYILENEPPKDETFYQVILFQNKEETNNTTKVKSLVAESFNSAVLDSAASKTVCGYMWFKVFCESQPHAIPTHPSSARYKFGASQPVVATKCAVIAAVLGKKVIHISTDIVDIDIPFLLSREAMKKLNMIINFGTDSATILGTTYPLTITSSGHYTIPLTPSTQLLSTYRCIPDTQVFFTATSTLSKPQQALKLHRQFAHAPADRVISLLNAAGKPWSSDQELKSELHMIEKNCQTCLEYGKELSRPSVGLPSANNFQDTVALDLKFYDQKILIHLIDHATRYSACGRIPSKQPHQVVKAMFANWIVIFGPPQKFLSDNGGEFINQELLDLCEVYNITLKTTGAEAPWSNGLVERHNQVLGNMLDRVLNDMNCPFDIALAWCVNAKNSLQNVHGFSPYQLVFGNNPVLPGPFTNRPPALEDVKLRSSDIVRDNLNAQQASRVAFMESERSERLRRALRTSTRTYSDQVIVNGDKVYYKRKDSKRWKGPAFVLGKDGQQVLVKHGGYYIRVHPCRVKLAREQPDTTHQGRQKELQQQADPSKDDNNLPSDSSSDSEGENDNELPEVPNPNHEGAATENIDSVPPTDPLPSLQSFVSPTKSVPLMQPHVPTPPSGDRKSPYRLRRQRSTNALPTVEKLPDSHETSGVPVKANSQVISFKQGDKLLIKLKNSEMFIPCMLIKRSGKVSSKKYKNEWNVQYSSGDVAVINFDVDVSDWMISERSSSDAEVMTVSTDVDVETEKAKHDEMEAWRSHQVYDEVINEGQEYMTVRWVITPKMIDGHPSVKARLVAKGFQELQDFRKDSPTCSRESIRLVLAIIASKKWDLHGFDIRRAFLQGDPIDRIVFLKPPPEANTTMLWKLNKCVYGLGDAPRSFYLKLRRELTKLNVTQSVFDQGLYFFFENSQLAGILSVHVDDIIHGGNSNFLTSVIKPLSEILMFSTEYHSMFEYLGLHLIQNSDYSISVNQTSFTKSIKKILLPPNCSNDDLLSTEAREMFRSAVGQLTWLSGISRPEIAYHVCVAATVASSATVRDALQLNKVIKRVQNSTSFITYPSLEFSTIHVRVYTDGSYNSLPNGFSQGGQIAFLADSQGNSCPIAWKSSKLKRVVRSALASETLSLCDGCELAHYLSALIEPIGISKQPVQGYIDSQSLFEALGTTSQVTDRRLRVEISALRQMIEDGDVRVNWLPKEQQLADALTKPTASDKLLVQVLQEGAIPNY